MQHYNVLIGVDYKYYIDWGERLLTSIYLKNPFLKLHCHIVNPEEYKPLRFVDYTHEDRDFANEDSKVGYLQAVRFLAVANKFSKDDLVFTLDADTICTREVDLYTCKSLFRNNHILQHHKEPRWLAGFVTFPKGNFHVDYANKLLEENIDNWKFGRDQKVLSKLSEEYLFKPLPKSWMAIGKNKSNSVFLTLKGEQKETEKYLTKFLGYEDENIRNRRSI
jgi:hypothetical protein